MAKRERSDHAAKQQRWAFAQWRDTGLPDEDRHDLAGHLFRRDIASWNDLADKEINVVAWALRGWHLVHTLRLQRRGRCPQCKGEGVIR